MEMNLQAPEFQRANSEGYTFDKALMLLRNQQPFLPILQWPSTVKTVMFVETADTLLDIAIPDCTKLIRFTSTNGLDYAVNINGNPDALNDTAIFPVSGVVEGGTLVNPGGELLFYVEGCKSLTLRNLNITKGFVSIQCFIQQ